MDLAKSRQPRKTARRKHRPHTPAVLGPRIYQPGAFWWVDLRAFDGQREPMRDPTHPNWPHAGEKTTDGETAERWKWRYLDHYRTDAKRRHLGLRGPAKPLGAEVERYLAHIERNKAIKTLGSHKAPLTADPTGLVPHIGKDVATDTVDRVAVQAWTDHLVARAYAIGTVQSYLAVVRAFFRWRSDGKHDPTHGVQIPDPGERDVEPWTDGELVKLRDAADALDHSRRDDKEAPALRSFRLLLELGLGSGCRLAELGALDWSAFDAEDKTVRVRWQVPPDGHGTTLQPLKGRRNRTALVLPSWWDFHDATATGRIVLCDGVTHISHRALGRWFERIATKAGLKRPNANAHQTRHTYARLALEMGARLEELQKFLGHASIRTTEASYGWLTEQAATTLARSRIYGTGLQVIRPKTRRKGTTYGRGVA